MKNFFVIFLCLFVRLAPAAPLKLALNWKPEPQFGGFYAADFAKHNLQVEILEGGSGTPTLQMVSNGQADYAVISADELLIAFDRGNKNLVALFATYQTNPAAIMTHAESNYQSIEELLRDEKATLLWQQGLPYAQFFLKKYSGQIKVKTAPYAGGIGLFQNNKKIAQQCFITSEPLAAEKQGLKVKSLLIADSGYNPYTTVLVTQKSRVSKNLDEVKKVFAAVREGWQNYLKDPIPTNQKMYKLNRAMDLDTFQKSALAQINLIETVETKRTGLGSMSLDRWNTLATQLKDLGVVKTVPNSKENSELFLNL